MTDKEYERFCKIVRNERKRMGKTLGDEGMSYFEWLNGIVDRLDSTTRPRPDPLWIVKVMRTMNEEYPKFKHLTAIGTK